MVDSFKGILYPARLPTFHREPAPESVADLVQWFWIPEWDIEPGHTSRQHVIAFPASNLVVQKDGVEFAGPTTSPVTPRPHGPGLGGGCPPASRAGAAFHG